MGDPAVAPGPRSGGPAHCAGIDGHDAYEGLAALYDWALQPYSEVTAARSSARGSRR